MDDSEKALRDLLGRSTTDFGSPDVVSRAREAQRSIEKLTTFGVLGDDKLSRIMRGLPSREIERAMEIAGGSFGRLDSLFNQASMVDQVKIKALQSHSLLEKYDATRRAIDQAIGGFDSFEGTVFGRAQDAVAKLSIFHEHKFGNGLDERIAESIQRIMDPYTGLNESQARLLGIGREAASAFARTTRWADALAGSSAREHAKLLGIGDHYANQFEALNLAAQGITAATDVFGGNNLATRSAAFSRDLIGLGDTATKMSLFAGSLDVFGPGSGGSQAAYAALLGGYATPAMLDRQYWRDPRERARYYRDQEVDEGLIDADNAATVAVLIDSGVVEGKRTRAGTITAVVEAGPVSVRIMASRPKMGAFAVIDMFENGLRAFVAAKLLAAQGANWFTQRVPGEIVGRAKNRRREAMRAGEPALDLIYYTDLGDLIGVITRKDNWNELFEAVFDRAEWLRVDLERLTANRRPTMHGRPVDPVQLCEIVFTIRRLAGWMERDGAWARGWDDDI